MKKTLYAAAAFAAIALAAPASAQGLIGGAEQGARNGADAAGPVGAIVGGAVGAATGTVNGILGIDQGPRFRSYVDGRRISSYDYEGDVRIGAVLPSSGVTYYEVPAEYGARQYRYTRVNDRVVLVDPGSRRVVQVID
jgi:hypothetical protein